MNIVVGVLMGLAYVLPPGPVTIETVRRSVQGGVWAALAVQLGAVGGDLVYAALVFAGLGQVLLHPVLRFTLGLVGAMLLMYQGFAALRDRAMIGGQVIPIRSPSPTPLAATLSWWHYGGGGFTLALANPYALLFWVAIGSTTLDNTAPSLLGFFLGSLLASVLTALMAGQPRGHRTLRLASKVWIVCGALLTLLGVQLVYTTLTAWWPS